jgi:hypothetical protein
LPISRGYLKESGKAVSSLSAYAKSPSKRKCFVIRRRGCQFGNIASVIQG